MNNFNERINFIYKKLFKSRYHFANAIGVKYPQVGHILRGARGMSQSSKELLATKYRVNLHWLETGEGEPFTLQIAEDLASYTADPVAAELFDILAQLDEADRARILQEAKDRLLLKEIRTHKGREKAG